MNKLGVKYKAIKDIKERRKAFLLDAASFYNSNNRSFVDYNTCLYSAGPNSPGCAIGRCLGKSTAARFDRMGNIKSSFGGSGIAEVFSRDYLKNRVPVWMREMGLDFLRAMQGLHDQRYNWNEKGLTKDGKRIAKDIQNNYF